MKKILLLFIVCFLVIPINTTFANPSIENAIQTKLGNENVSVSIRSLDNGEVLYTKNGDALMKPASTLKLLTAAAALEVLGPNYRFHTKLYIDGEIREGVLEGDIYVKGEGDPTLQEKNFKAFAKALKDNGITKISGNLYGDDTVFSGSQLTPGITSEDESYYYAARTTALTMSPDNDYDSGTIIVHVQPASVGQPPTIRAEPNLSGMVVENKGVTVNRGEQTTIEIIRQHRTNKIIISGNIPMGETFKDWVTLYDPTINTLHSIKNTLEQEKISMATDAIVERKEVPESANLIYSKHSLPLNILITPFLKLSNNSIADILVKTMGREIYGIGNTSYGVKVLKKYGANMGLNMNQWKLEDGSGMSHKNRISANELTLLLHKLRKEVFFDDYYNSLPVGGHKDRFVGGSLRNRFKEQHIQNLVIAKTGHISGVYTLAGYVKANSGRTYAFSVMTQHQTTNKIDEIDTIIKEIIQYY